MDSNSKYLLILEYADSGTLGDYLKDNFDRLDWNMKLRFAIQIADAVLCIHQNDIIHCDLVCFINSNFIFEYKYINLIFFIK